MSKTISDEEYKDLQRLKARDKQVDEYMECSLHDYWMDKFERTSKPKQYRPTLDELVEVYRKEIGGLSVTHLCRAGLKAVIEKVFEGVMQEYNADKGSMVTLPVIVRHRQSYKEE